ncbi:MEKHLA domain-containing protein [Pseudonocardia spinosispora]|uniref:MEKHLA domain-containing protein n=1 Tax=Pseudonocardia spinosispora TaxID=103441 RepID=UPI00068532EF|nr:MEKHLA domain-containing protein [Pseudonocardia spinosispora]
MSQTGLRPTGCEDPAFARLLAESHLRTVGTKLVDVESTAADAAHWLYHEAPFGLLAHERGSDPVFRYANRTAQRAFGYDWSEFDGLRSQLSAATPDRAERAHLLDEVTRNGYFSGYRGLRISKSGAQFWIENTTVWNVIDEHGELRGQAATFTSVTPA